MSAGQWRVGGKIPLHVYEQRGERPSVTVWPNGDRPVATFHEPADARRAVTAVNGVGVPPDDIVTVDDDSGQGSASLPTWTFDSGLRIEGADTIMAWPEGVDADGDMSSGAALDAIEADAYRVLAAVAAHRRMARRDPS